MEKPRTKLNPVEALLRAKPKPLQAAGILAGHYKRQDEGGLSPLLASQAAARRAEARRGGKGVGPRRQPG